MHSKNIKNRMREVSTKKKNGLFSVTLELVCLGGEERSLRLELLEVEDVLQLLKGPSRGQGLSA
jgi:hypothetical protein